MRIPDPLGSAEPRSGILVSSLTSHYDELVGYVGRKFGDNDFARVVVHEVCAELLKNPGPTNIRQPLAFLRRVLSNRAIDHRRSDAARARLAERLAGMPDTPSGEDATTYLHGLQITEELARVILALPDRARQVFILHRLYHMPQAAIARELGLSCNTIAKHHACALRIIRQQWALASLAPEDDPRDVGTPR